MATVASSIDLIMGYEAINIISTPLLHCFANLGGLCPSQVMGREKSLGEARDFFKFG